MAYLETKETKWGIACLVRHLAHVHGRGTKMPTSVCEQGEAGLAGNPGLPGPAGPKVSKCVLPLFNPLTSQCTCICFLKRLYCLCMNMYVFVYFPCYVWVYMFSTPLTLRLSRMLCDTKAHFGWFPPEWWAAGWLGFGQWTMKSELTGPSTVI